MIIVYSHDKEVTLNVDGREFVHFYPPKKTDKGQIFDFVLKNYESLSPNANLFRGHFAYIKYKYAVPALFEKIYDFLYNSHGITAMKIVWLEGGDSYYGFSRSKKSFGILFGADRRVLAYDGENESSLDMRDGSMIVVDPAYKSSHVILSKDSNVSDKSVLLVFDLQMMIIVILLVLVAFLVACGLGHREGLSFENPINTAYLPYYHYSLPYQYRDSGAWPPSMFTRLNYWEPTFSSGSGWMYWMRPGVEYKDWPFGRWVRHGKDNFYINNLNDRSKDYYGIS